MEADDAPGAWTLPSLWTHRTPPQRLGKPHSTRFRASSERLARSAGGSPARATARSPVAWIAGSREIEDLKPIDNPIGRMGASHRAATEVNADVASKERSPEGPTCETGVKAAWERHTLAQVPAHFGGVGSGGTVTRTR